ncbi:PrgI family mobile element protein [Paenibacillus sp. IITD108]|uniref:PrgI family mobile element protein n=1 Tax=Paenibacillus sp. IITD108 TaxID=3116649 RepID=UPI002F420A69
MRARMPFDTEKERKTIKFFSYRQVAYLAVSFIVYIQLIQTIYTDSMGFFGMIILIFVLLPVKAPFLYFALVTNSQTGYYMDRHLYYYLRHKKQIGVWRKR